MATSTQLGLMGPYEGPSDFSAEVPDVGWQSQQPPKKSAAVVSSLVPGLINGIAQIFTNRSNRRFAREQADTAYRRQLDLIADQRAYDSPSAQMQRFIDAGLNPNLIYGQIHAPGSPVTAPNGAAFPSAAPSFGFDPSTMLIDAQIENLRSQSRVNDKEVDWKDADIKRLFKGLDVSDQQIQEMKAHADFMKQNAATMKALEFKYQAESGVLSEEARIKQLDRLFKEQNFETQSQLLANELKISNERARFITKSIMASIYKDNALASYYANKASLTPDERTLLRDQAANYRGSTAYYQNNARYIGEKAKNAAEKDKSEIVKNAAQTAQAYANTVHGAMNGLVEWFSPFETVTSNQKLPNGKTVTVSKRKFKPWRLLFRH